MSIETDLREALAARAEAFDLATAGDPYARVTTAVRRSQRRRRAGVAAGLVAVTAVALAVPSALDRGRDRTSPPATTVVVPGPDSPVWRSIGTWPVRGDLAGDSAYLAAAEPRVVGSRILFAGDVGTERVVVSWSEPQDGEAPEGAVHLATSGLGAPATDLRQVATGAPASSALVTVRPTDLPDAPLVVLGTPSVRTVDVSSSAVLGADAVPRRTPWVRHDLDQGAAVIALTDAPVSLTRVRVGGYDGQAFSLVGNHDVEAHPDEAICLDLCADFSDRAIRSTTRRIADLLGLAVGDVRTSVVYDGPVDRTVAGAAGVTDAEAGELRLFVTNSTIPSGGVLRTSTLVHANGEGTGELMDLEVGIPVEAASAQDRPFVLHGLDPSLQDQVFEVFSPGATTARITSDSPTILPDSPRRPVVGGRVALRAEGSGGIATRVVETYDSSGTPIGRWPVGLDASDPYDTSPG